MEAETQTSPSCVGEGGSWREEIPALVICHHRQLHSLFSLGRRGKLTWRWRRHDHALEAQSGELSWSVQPPRLTLRTSLGAAEWKRPYPVWWWLRRRWPGGEEGSQDSILLPLLCHHSNSGALLRSPCLPCPKGDIALPSGEAKSRTRQAQEHFGEPEWKGEYKRRRERVGGQVYRFSFWPSSLSH